MWLKKSERSPERNSRSLTHVCPTSATSARAAEASSCGWFIFTAQTCTYLAGPLQSYACTERHDYQLAGHPFQQLVDRPSCVLANEEGSGGILDYGGRYSIISSGSRWIRSLDNAGCGRAYAEAETHPSGRLPRVNTRRRLAEEAEEELGWSGSAWSGSAWSGLGVGAVSSLGCGGRFRNRKGSWRDLRLRGWENRRFVGRTRDRLIRLS